MAAALDNGSGDGIDWHRVGKKVAGRMADLRKSVEQIAAAALVAPATVRRCKSGEHAIRPEHVYAIFKALGLEFHESDFALAPLGSSPFHARPEYGGYAYADYQMYVGHYLGYRRSFSEPGKLVRSVFKFEIHIAEGYLGFHEHQRYKREKFGWQNNSQGGVVHTNAQTATLHLVTSGGGLVRLITLTKMIGGERDRILKGAVLTQRDLGPAYAPGMSPIFLEKIQDPPNDETRDSFVGKLDKTNSEFDRAYEMLAHIEEKVSYYAPSGFSLKSPTPN